MVNSGEIALFSLGEQVTVNQAEIVAIINAVDYIIWGGRLAGAVGHVVICSDSRVSLPQLQRHETTSRLTWECHVALNVMANRCRVTLMWVPGHEGIEGNERADRVAKKAAESKPVGPQQWQIVVLVLLEQRELLWSETVG